jgi:hypothetical protein
VRNATLIVTNQAASFSKGMPQPSTVREVKYAAPNFVCNINEGRRTLEVPLPADYNTEINTG